MSKRYYGISTRSDEDVAIVFDRKEKKFEPPIIPGRFVCVFNIPGGFRQTYHSLAPASLGPSASMRRAQPTRITIFACQTYV